MTKKTKQETLEVVEEKYFSELKKEMDSKKLEIKSLQAQLNKKNDMLDAKNEETKKLKQLLAEAEEKALNAERTKDELRAEIKQELSEQSFSNALKAASDYEKSEKERVDSELALFEKEKKAEITKLYEEDLVEANSKKEQVEKEILELTTFRDSAFNQVKELQNILSGGISKITNLDK